MDSVPNFKHHGVVITAAEKWKRVQDRLATNGVQANVSQIRSKWERLAGDFKKVGDWNKQSGNEPYSSLTAKNRRDHKSPLNFPEDVYNAMDIWMHRRHSMNECGVSESGGSGNDSAAQTPDVSATRSVGPSEQFEGPDSTDDDPAVEQPVAPAHGGRSLPPDATGVSNSGKRRKSASKQDGVIDAISQFSSQLVEIEKSLGKTWWETVVLAFPHWHVEVVVNAVFLLVISYSNVLVEN
ncbi:hypothetical protein R1sor_024953 [Riccia sorocarpa]|uniref:MADF domain-containing protein n=1 Tax=Riccia sorocarpa TaxID=122646 RepID=A0ABD3GAB4_9MARC